MDMTRSDLAAHLGVSVATLRSWEKRFGDMMTSEQPPVGPGREKVYNDHDVRMFSLVRRGRDDGRSLDDIASTLEADLEDFALDTGELLETVAQQHEDDVPDGDKQLMLVGALRAQVAFAEQRVDALEADLDDVREQLASARERAAAGDAVRDERDRLLAQVEQLRSQVEQERIERERAAAKLEAYQKQPGFWRRLFGGRG